MMGTGIALLLQIFRSVQFDKCLIWEALALKVSVFKRPSKV
jgi:hypothetical protein